MKVHSSISFRNLLLFFYTALWVLMLVAVWGKIRHNDGWAIADWLIHYQDGGFKRRGLLGTVFVFLGSYIPVKALLFSFLGSLYSAFFYLIYRFSVRLDFQKNLLFLLLLPGVLLYPVFEKPVIGRKEILLLLFFLWVCYRYPFRQKALNWLLIPMYFILILIHEMAFFFLPYLCLVLYKDTPEKKQAKAYIVTLVTGSILIMMLLLIYGKAINGGYSLANLESIGYLIQCESNLNDCSIFSWVQDESFMARFQNGLGAMAAYLLSFAASVYIFLVFVKKELVPKVILMVLGFVFFSLPLFYLGIDWGRWINIHLCLMVFLLMRYPYAVNYIQRKPWVYAVLFLLSVLLLAGHSSDGFLWLS